MTTKNAFFAHLERQNISISWQRYGIDTLNFMALGLFGSLILGLILKNIGTWMGFEPLVTLGGEAQKLMGAAIGVGVAYALKAPPLVLFTSVITGFLGAQMGGPVGALIATLVAAECGKFIHRTTPIDIIITPMTTLLFGALIAASVSPAIGTLMTQLGALIMWAVALSPILMSIVVAVAMGLLLTLPISSAAIAIALGLGDTAAGAATVGCAAQMIGFAVMSYRDNGIGGTLACGLGTSMIQMSNILKNPKIWLPPTITSALLAPFATAVFGMTNLPTGAGMGTSGLVGQIATLDAMGATTQTLALIAVFHLLLPALITWLIALIFYKKDWIKDGDLRIER